MIRRMNDLSFLKIARAFALGCLIIAAAGVSSVRAQPRFGPRAVEGQPARRQFWIVPSSDTSTDSHAMLYRPIGEGPFRLAVIAHASTQNALRRAQMPQPDYRELSVQLVARGFAVLVPERPGHGATGGPYLEDQGNCPDVDYVKAGRATADSIRAALSFMQSQPFIL
jgi:dienelactone hydrolase